MQLNAREKLHDTITTVTEAKANTCNMDNSPKQRDSAKRIHYIPEWAARRNLQQVDVVKFTGADKGLVSRWFNGTLPKGNYLNLLAKLFKIKSSQLFLDPTTVLSELGEETPVETQMPVDGYAAASTWQELDDLGHEPREWIPFGQDPAYSGRRQYAIEIRGNSMDRLIKSGEYAIVIDAFGQSPRDGDVVVVRRIRGGLVERTVKRYRETVNGAVLMPDSTDPRHEPIPATGDGETSIEIEAFVIGRYGRIGNR